MSLGALCQPGRRHLHWADDQDGKSSVDPEARFTIVRYRTGDPTVSYLGFGDHSIENSETVLRLLETEISNDSPTVGGLEL